MIKENKNSHTDEANQEELESYRFSGMELPLKIEVKARDFNEAVRLLKENLGHFLMSFECHKT